VAAARLSHPCIVSTFDTGDDDGTAYIVMELVEGPTLRHLIQDSGGLPVRDVVRLGSQVADALDAAHRAGLVHRDVKPANVLVPPHGPVKVTDFGIATSAGAGDLTRTGTVMGTARYLAPEQVSGRPTDARTDVYALGLLMFEALTGHPPFGGDTDVATAMARLTTTAPAVRAERADVPPALDDVIHRCLARNPDQRFDSAAEVREALRRTELDPTGSIPRVATGAHAVQPSTHVAPVAPAAATVAAAGAMNPRGADDTGTAPVPRAAPAPARKRRGRVWPWVLLLVLAVALLAGAAAAILLTDSSSGGGTSGAPSPADAQVTATAAAFDPFGNPPGDENNAAAANAVDGDPTTVWSTEQYQNFSEKPGVGLVLDLGQEVALRRVTVDATPPGWSGQVYLSASPVGSLSTLGDWGEAAATVDGVAGTSHTFTFDATRARSVLVWFTQLPAGDGGQSLQVSEITVG
jgi:serine/threonine-protein kinase